MKYEYLLSKYCQSKYGFKHLLCNGWYGIHADTFNEKWTDGARVEISLSENDIDLITNTATKYREYL